MATFRVHKNANYTVMSNHHLRNKGLSLKAKGLLSLMLSLPNDWDYSIKGLATLSNDGKDAVMSTLNELEKFGYLIRTRSTNEKGQFQGYEYDIYEDPKDRPFSDPPKAENPYTENPNTGNPPQINTNKPSIEEPNKEKELDKIDKLDKRLSPDFRDLREEDKYISPMDHCGKPNAFTKELIKGGYIDEDDLYLTEYNKEFAMLQAEYGYETVRSCLWYFLKQHKFRNGIDDNGEEVQNKLAYFRNAMRRNAEGLRSRNSIADGSVGGWLAE